MRKIGTLIQFARAVTLVAVLFAIAISLPPAAHANMMAQSGVQYQYTQNDGVDLDHIKMDHDSHVMASGMPHKKTSGGHDGAQCCVGVCGDVIASTIDAPFITDEVHSHHALPYLAMASAERSHLMRPPNL